MHLMCSSRAAVAAATSLASSVSQQQLLTFLLQTSSGTTVDVTEDVAVELLDDQLRPLSTTRFLSCNHLLPTRPSRLLHCRVWSGEGWSWLSRLWPYLLCSRCRRRQPDSELQLALEWDAIVVCGLEIVLLDDIPEVDCTAADAPLLLFSVPYIFPAFLASEERSSKEHLCAVRKELLHSLSPISSALVSTIFPSFLVRITMHCSFLTCIRSALISSIWSMKVSSGLLLSACSSSRLG